MEDVASSASSTDHMLDMAENLVTQCKKMAGTADELFHPKEKWEAAKEFSRQHPAVAFFVIILGAMSIVPLVCFCAFAVCTTLAVLASCLFFEAFALIVGAFILLGVLSFAAFLAFGSSILFAGSLYILALSRTTMSRIRSTATHYD